MSKKLMLSTLAIAGMIFAIGMSIASDAQAQRVQVCYYEPFHGRVCQWVEVP